MRTRGFGVAGALVIGAGAAIPLLLVASARSRQSRARWLTHDGRSVLSWASLLSVGSAASLLSVGSFASILSVASSASILSVGSHASILSVGSHASILSVGSHGSLLGVGSAGARRTVGSRMPCVRHAGSRPATGPRRAG